MLDGSFIVFCFNFFKICEPSQQVDLFPLLSLPGNGLFLGFDLSVSH